jgi:hypothetical protein
LQDKEKGVYVAGAKEHPVETEDELLQVMQVGSLTSASFQQVLVHLHA